MPQLLPLRLSLENVKAIIARHAAAAKGEWGAEYHPYPSAFDSDGEPNPPAAFVGPKEWTEAIALVFKNPEEDPSLEFDSPSQRANSDFIVQAHNDDIPSLCADHLAMAEEIETLHEIVREDRENWSFDSLVYFAKRLLKEVYPEDIFTGASGDAGPLFIVALREALQRKQLAEAKYEHLETTYGTLLEYLKSLE